MSRSRCAFSCAWNVVWNVTAEMLSQRHAGLWQLLIITEAPVEAHVFPCGGPWAGVQKLYDAATQSKGLASIGVPTL